MNIEHGNKLIYKEDYFGFVYLWYDKFRDKLCIGSHFGSMNDKYTTSTGHCKYAIKKRPTDFKRIILYAHPINDRKKLLEVEQTFLNVIPEDMLGNYFYNRKKFASGGCVIGIKRSEETKRKMSLSQKGKKRNQKFVTEPALKILRSKKTCPFCNIIMDLGNYSKFHGKNCKHNPNVNPEVLLKRSLIGKLGANIKKNKVKYDIEQ